MNRSRTTSESAARMATLQQNQMPMFPDAGLQWAFEDSPPWLSCAAHLQRKYVYLPVFTIFLVDRDRIASAQLLPGSAHDDPEGLGVPPLLTDEFSGVIRVGVDGKGGTVFCYLSLDDNEFRPVNQCADDFE